MLHIPSLLRLSSARMLLLLNVGRDLEDYGAQRKT